MLSSHFDLRARRLAEERQEERRREERREDEERRHQERVNSVDSSSPLTVPLERVVVIRIHNKVSPISMLELRAVHRCISSRRNSRYAAARSDALSTPANGVT